ncbi:ABC transporter A family member 7-like [Musa acuminata AAA Group]|uniref:ABC transporter A family member 7-like n=1 Tax=Musa acuminata AAA Group TaxID=214697 RepID=UPI0031E33BD2
MELSASYLSRGAASFFTQANALHRKNLTFQKLNLKTNIEIVAFPIFLCAVIFVIQNVVEDEMNKDGHRYGCQGGVCSSLFEWPALLQVPGPESRAVTSDHPTPAGLPDESCKVSQSCPALVLFTGGNQSFAQKSASEFFLRIEPLGFPQQFVYCHASYDFLNSDENSFNLNIGYNSTCNDGNGYLVRVPHSVNLASNAYLKFHDGPVVMAVLYLKEMPKTGTQSRFDISSLLSALFFTWIIELLFPVILTYLVHERQQKLNIMMEMHGLRDGPYWLISYVYFFSLSSLYMICSVIFGSLIGLKFFRLSDYSVQIVFYFFYINLQIAMAFLASPFFSAVKTATVTGYIYVFGSGLLGPYLLQSFIEDTSFPRAWIIMMELIPGFSLYRGLYELSQYSFKGYQMGTSGMQWGDLNDRQNGMKDVLIIMFVEWLVFLLVAFYLDQVLGGIRKVPLFLLNYFQKKSPSSQRNRSLRRRGFGVPVETESSDVSQEVSCITFQSYCKLD